MRFSRALNVVDAHAEGESGKVVVGGIGPVLGKSVFDKMRSVEEHYDQLRKLQLMLLQEPRGAMGHKANVVLPSHNAQADMGYIILGFTEYPLIPGITNTAFAGPLDQEQEEDGAEMIRSRNATVVSPGRIGRSPCGTGTSARLRRPVPARTAGTGTALPARVARRQPVRRPCRVHHHGRAVRRRRTEHLRARLDHLLQTAGPRSDRPVPERLRDGTPLGAGGLTALRQKP
jgi:proline racemase